MSLYKYMHLHIYIYMHAYMSIGEGREKQNDRYLDLREMGVHIYIFPSAALQILTVFRKRGVHYKWGKIRLVGTHVLYSFFSELGMLASIAKQLIC